jgi:hypothetical protein
LMLLGPGWAGRVGGRRDAGGTPVAVRPR